MSRLHYEAMGEGPALLMLHGLFGSGTNWRSIARRLLPGRRIVLVDARNHGRSPHAADMSYAQMADDVLALMDDLDLPQATLLGHSMGGKTAMTLALRHPERVQRLIVADIAPVRYRDHDHMPLIEAMRALPLTSLRNRAEADELLSASVADRSLRAFLLHNLESRPDSTGGYRWRINLDAIEAGLADLFDFEGMLDGRYDGPVLFVRGGHSTYVSDEDFAQARRWFPHAVLRTVDGAGHWLHAEQPEAFTNIVNAFMEQPG
ncbi:MAG: alpha/beta fold hydrolase [Gammaproteobacteria bacterium]|nr:alpha/beta fold hydrolase [Gammaproteobacteria bacterium]